MPFKDQTVWITGASSGIGKALALAFASRGANLILSSRNHEKLEAVKAACPDDVQVWIEPMDTSDYDSIPAIAERVLREVGPVDILVNNAGISQRGIVSETPIEIDRRIMDTNFFGSVALTKAVLPLMLKRGTGKIVVISSLTGKFGTPLRSAYAASKHALHGYFASLRAEVHDAGLRVLLVCPGFIRTDVSMNALKSDGSPQNKLDDAQAGGMSPDVLAEKILRAIERDKLEVYFGGKEILGIYLKRFFPRFFANYIRKAKVT